MKGRLQFRHDTALTYSSFEEIKTLLENKLQLRDEKIIPLYAEPAVFRYVDENHKIHLVLGIGNDVEDARYPNEDYKYTLLDLDPIIAGANGIANVIKGLGFNEDGSFTPDNDYKGGRFSEIDPNIAAYVKELKDKLFSIKIEYDAENMKVVLKYGDEEFSSFPANEFVKNELLRDVDVIANKEDADRLDPTHPASIENMLPYLFLKWNTSPGGNPDADPEEKIVRIQLSELVDIYTGGNGIEVSDDYKISVVVDPSTESYLTLSPSGLKVAGIDTALEDVKDYAEDLVNNAVSETDELIEEVASAITSEVRSNRIEIEKLKDFAEYQVGSIEGEVISTVVKSNRDRIEDLESKVNDPDGGLDNKVDKVEGKGLSTNDYTNEEKALLATLSENAQENVIETVKVNGVALDVNQDKAVNVEVPFTSLSNNEKMLTLNGGVLESMFSVDYDTDAKKIFFYGKTGQKLGEVDVTEFLVDGMIRSVNVVTEDGVKYLKFVFNTDAGAREIKIALTDLVTEYTVSGGSENYLTIDNFKIGLKVDQPDYSGLASSAAVHDLDDKYSAITHSLEDMVGEGILDDSGNTISLTHKVNELDDAMANFVDENKLEFDEDFKIAGIIGTLGTGKWKNGDVIPAGTKVMDVLKDILQQRLLPEGVAPSATIKLVNPSPVEVGSVISPVYEIKFNNGVYNYADGTTGATLISVDSASVILLNNGSNTPNTSTAYPNGTFQNVVATDGMNLSVMANISYSSTYVPKDNLGADVPENKIPDGMLEFVRSENAITSYRPMFYGSLRDGDIADYDNITSAEALSLLSKAAGETVDRVVVNDDAEVVVIMIPVMSNKEVKKIIDTDSGFDLIDVFERHQTVIKTYDGEESATTSYYAYVYDPKTQIGANVYRIIYS